MYLGGVAVGFHIEHTVRAVDIPPTNEVQRRLRAPVGPVVIERVFANLTVVADQSFLVDVGQITLAARVAREVEQVPDERAPKIRTLMQSTPGGFVVEILIFLGVWATVRVDGATVRIVAVLCERSS